MVTPEEAVDASQTPALWPGALEEARELIGIEPLGEVVTFAGAGSETEIEP